MRPEKRSLTVSGNRVELLQDGREAFPAMLAAIAAARRTVNLETYILRGDRTGEKLAAALSAAARRGLEVNLLYDAMGSLGISGEFLRELSGAGIRVHAYHPLLAFLRHPRLARNHRKSLIVDGRVGIVGGMNIADEYASVEDGGEGWRDNAILVEGPAVRDLQGLFVSTWNRHSGIPLAGESYFPQLEPRGDQRVRVIGNNRRRQRRAIRRAYFSAMKRAEEFIWLENSYFVPDRGIRRIFRNARKRGVEVAILTAGKTDLRSVQYAARATYDRLLRNGVRVLEWERTVFHAKTAIVDAEWATVGSYNLDAVSLSLNLEVTVVVEGEAFGARVAEMIRGDLAASRELELAEWRRRAFSARLLERVFYAVRRFL